MSESTNSPRRVSAAKKRRKALELRKGGLSYQRIADTPIDRANGDERPLYGNKGSAHRAVADALEELRAQTEETAHEVLDLELARLDEMHAGVWVKAIRGDDKAIAAVIRLMERRTRYLGLDFADGLDERHLEVQEQEVARTNAAFEHALRAVGMDDAEIAEVFGYAAEHLTAGGAPGAGGAPSGDGGEEGQPGELPGDDGGGAAGPAGAAGG